MKLSILVLAPLMGLVAAGSLEPLPEVDSNDKNATPLDAGTRALDKGADLSAEAYCPGPNYPLSCDRWGFCCSASSVGCCKNACCAKGATRCGSDGHCYV